MKLRSSRYTSSGIRNARIRIIPINISTGNRWMRRVHCASVSGYMYRLFVLILTSFGKARGSINVAILIHICVAYVFALPVFPAFRHVVIYRYPLYAFCGSDDDRVYSIATRVPHWLEVICCCHSWNILPTSFFERDSATSSSQDALPYHQSTSHTGCI